MKAVVSGLKEFLSTESPLKMLLNAFNFTLEAFYVLKIFKSHVEKQYDEKDKINFKVHDVTWETKNCKHILTRISRSKLSHTMKFGLLIEYNIRSIFHEKLCTECVWYKNFSLFFQILPYVHSAFTLVSKGFILILFCNILHLEMYSENFPASTQCSGNICSVFPQRCNVRDIQGIFWKHFKGKDFLKSSRWKSCICVKSVRYDDNKC